MIFLGKEKIFNRRKLKELCELMEPTDNEYAIEECKLVGIDLEKNIELKGENENEVPL